MAVSWGKDLKFSPLRKGKGLYPILSFGVKKNCLTWEGAFPGRKVHYVKVSLRNPLIKKGIGKTGIYKVCQGLSPAFYGKAHLCLSL